MSAVIKELYEIIINKKKNSEFTQKVYSTYFTVVKNLKLVCYLLFDAQVKSETLSRF